MSKMSKFHWWIYCQDCKEYMELGKYNYSEGRWNGPTLLNGAKANSDWPLRRFLENHTGHRIGLMNDEDESIERKQIQEKGWNKIIPVTKWAMQFKMMDDLFDDIEFPLSAERGEPSERRVAVSVLTLKRPWFLLQCLTSLMENDTEFTLFLTNQGDEEKGTQMICNWWKNRPYVKYIYNDPPLFPGAARAKVFQIAYDMGFEYIITVDDDSCLESHAIDNLVKVADEHREYHAISGWFRGRARKYLLGGLKDLKTGHHENYKYKTGIHEADYVSNGFRLIRLSPLVLPDVNYTVGYTDWDYAEQLAEKGLRMATTGDAGGYHKHMKNDDGIMEPAWNPIRYKVRSRERTQEMAEYFKSKWGYVPT